MKSVFNFLDRISVVTFMIVGASVGFGFAAYIILNDDICLPDREVSLIWGPDGSCGISSKSSSGGLNLDWPCSVTVPGHYAKSGEACSCTLP